MSDDDDDYMSSSFLDVKEDIRPGLIPKAVKRKFDIEQKRIVSNKIFKTKSRKELEEESRNAGLDAAISSDNKGFLLLQKMGYKPGMKLGSEKYNSDSGLTEPIRVQVKSDRGGLGREEETRNRIKAREERRQKLKVYKEEETQILTKEFRERMRSKRTTRRVMKDLHKSQKICEQLDTENGVQEPMRPWFWYTVEKNSEDEEEDEQEIDEEELLPEEKVDFICEYIRPKYFYCYWCCIKYNDEDDLNRTCPGPERSDHDDLSS